MEKIELSIGEKIELRFQLSDGSYSSSYFTTEIINIISEREFLITPPDDNDICRWLGRIVSLTVPRDDGAYFAQARIMRQKNTDSLVLLEFQLLEDFVRKQRRDFFRLKVELDVYIEGYGSAKTVDISGSGMAIITEINFEDGERVNGNVSLDGNNIYFSGIVVRCQDVSEQYNLVCTYFNDINKDIQSTIVQFINSRLHTMADEGLPLV